MTDEIPIIVRKGDGNWDDETMQFTDQCEVIRCTPQPHYGWTSISYANQRYQVWGGHRYPNYILLDSPIRKPSDVMASPQKWQELLPQLWEKSREIDAAQYSRHKKLSRYQREIRQIADEEDLPPLSALIANAHADASRAAIMDDLRVFLDAETFSFVQAVFYIHTTERDDVLDRVERAK